MTIKIGEKLEKLDPADTYKLVDGADVEGFDTLKTQVDQHEQDKNAIDSRVTTAEGHIQTLQQTDIDLTNRVNTAEQHLQTLQQNDVTITAIAHGNTAAIQYRCGVRLSKSGETSGPEICEKKNRKKFCFQSKSTLA